MGDSSCTTYTTWAVAHRPCLYMFGMTKVVRAQFVIRNSGTFLTI